MTDNEIIKALECCKTNSIGDCRECPLRLKADILTKKWLSTPNGHAFYPREEISNLLKEMGVEGE